VDDSRLTTLPAYDDERCTG